MNNISRPRRIQEVGPGNIPANGTIQINAGQEESILVQGLSICLQNVGESTVYLSAQKDVTADMWEIAPGTTEGPFSANDRLYFASSKDSTLKYIFVEE